MDLRQLIQLQQRFDAARSTSFDWSAQITSDEIRPLVHNALALAGEAGEIANIVKKLDRGDGAFDQAMAELPGELADVMIYTMKLAYQSGIDLERAILDKVVANASRFPATADGGDWSDAHAVLARLFSRAGVIMPTDDHGAADISALAIEFSRAAAYEGSTTAQDELWEAIEPTVERYALNRSDLAALSRFEPELRRVLASLEPGASSTSE